MARLHTPEHMKERSCCAAAAEGLLGITATQAGHKDTLNATKAL